MSFVMQFFDSKSLNYFRKCVVFIGPDWLGGPCVRGCVCPSVGPSVRRSVRMSRVPIGCTPAVQGNKHRMKALSHCQNKNRQIRDENEPCKNRIGKMNVAWQKQQITKNKTGYAAQDAPSMRTFHLRKQRGTNGPTDGRTDGRTAGRTLPHIEMRRRI